MRRIALFITATIAGLILLFSYGTSRGARTAPTAASLGPHPAGIVTGSPKSAATGSAPPGTTNATVNGSAADTRWGTVQVQVVILGGRITDVTAIQYPQGNGRDDEINSYALPQLHDQVIAAQSANIDGVSGATVTSQGYIQSLQAALDLVHLG